MGRLQWRPADRLANRPAPVNRRGLADFFAVLPLAASNGSASGPASAENRLAGPLAVVGDALI